MNMIKIFYNRILKKHPLGALYGVLLGFVAFYAAAGQFKSGAWEAPAVDLAMAGILICLMLKSFISSFRRASVWQEKSLAWAMLIICNILAWLPSHDFPGSLSTAFAFTLLICAFVLYCSGGNMALHCVAPAVWCCVFMPYHEEFMLLLSYPLRLSATLLSGVLLKLCGIGAVCMGTTLNLPGLDIAITDACSGINQLDAFILIAFIAVQIMHRKNRWKILHLAFIIPSIIIGNSLRIAVTVLLYKLLGEAVLMNTWHVALGYVQIVLALVIFLLVGRIFSFPENKMPTEVQQ